MNSKVFIVSLMSSAVTGFGVYKTFTAYDGKTLVIDILCALTLAVFYAWIFNEQYQEVNR